MRVRSSWIRGTSLAMVAFLAVAGVLADDEDLGWSDSAELSLVATSGNANQQTWGLKNVLRRTWKPARFTFRIEAIRAENETTTKVATGAPTSFTVTETSSTEVTAERYLAELGYERKITDRFYWNVGGGWSRNRPSGIENWYNAYAGVGNIWKNKEKLKFSTSYNISYSDREDVVPNPTRDETFAGFLFTSEFFWKFTKTAAYTNDFIANANLSTSEDWAVNWTNAISVAMSETLGLKVGLQWLYQNLPAVEPVPLVPPVGSIDTVLVEKDELDTIFTASLVVNF